MNDNTSNDRRRLDVQVDAAVARYTHDLAYAEQTTVGAIVERALIDMRDEPLVRSIALNLIARSEAAYAWLGSIPLPEGLMEISDVLVDLHRIADSPAEWASRAGGTAGVALVEHAATVGRLLAAHAAAKSGGAK
jgi:hypothetical protein